MSHPLHGKWEINAKSPLGDMHMIATMNVNDDGKTFQGDVFETNSKKTYELIEGKVENNNISYIIIFKFGLIPLKFEMEGSFDESDWSCKGTGHAMKMQCTYEGRKLLEDV